MFSQELNILKADGIYNMIGNATPCAARIKNTIVSSKQNLSIWRVNTDWAEILVFYVC